MKGEIEKGRSLEEIKASLPMGAYASWGCEEMRPYAPEAVYRELSGPAMRD